MKIGEYFNPLQNKHQRIPRKLWVKNIFQKVPPMIIFTKN